MGCIQERRGYIRVDGMGAGVRELSRLYQDFAVACVERQLERAVVLGDGDPEDQLSLRDAFMALVLGGIAPGFRIALVAGTGPVRDAFLGLQGELHRLGVDAAVFGSEDDAHAWLLAYCQAQQAAGARS